MKYKTINKHHRKTLRTFLKKQNVKRTFLTLFYLQANGMLEKVKQSESKNSKWSSLLLQFIIEYNKTQHIFTNKILYGPKTISLSNEK